jgi:hypothetical protein
MQRFSGGQKTYPCGAHVTVEIDDSLKAPEILMKLVAPPKPVFYYRMSQKDYATMPCLPKPEKEGVKRQTSLSKTPAKNRVPSVSRYTYVVPNCADPTESTRPIQVSL